MTKNILKNNILYNKVIRMNTENDKEEQMYAERIAVLVKKQKDKKKEQNRLYYQKTKVKRRKKELISNIINLKRRFLHGTTLKDYNINSEMIEKFRKTALEKNLFDTPEETNAYVKKCNLYFDRMRLYIEKREAIEKFQKLK